MNAITPATRPDLDLSPFPCICCGRVLCNVVSVEQCPNQPYDAATFDSNGHYGTSMFDPMDSSRIEINVCDDCLKAAKERGHVGYWPPNPKRKLRKWEGE